MQTQNGIEYLEAGPANADKTIVFMHGYGANAADLFSLSAELNVKARMIFPQGPLRVPIGPGFTGQAWFPIDVEAIERRMQTGEVLDYSKNPASRIRHVVDRMIGFLDGVVSPQSELVLGGFSQGSMLATELTAVMPKPPSQLVILSGTLFDEQHLRAELPKRPEVRYFQSHGERDAVLPMVGAERLNEVLEASGLTGEFVRFGGGHEIPMRVLQQLERFLR